MRVRVRKSEGRSEPETQKKKNRMRLPLRFDVHMIPSDGLERVAKESRWGENEEVGNLHRGPQSRET